MQLTDNHPLSPVDDEGALFGHDRNVAHVDPLRHFGTVDLEQKINVQRRIVNFAVLDAVDHVALLLAGRADLVGDKFERHLLVEAFDRENLVEHLLEPLILPLRRRHVALEEITVRVNLEADQIRNFENVPELPKINSFRHTLLVSGCMLNYVKIFAKKFRRSQHIPPLSAENSMVKRQKNRPVDKTPHRQFGNSNQIRKFFQETGIRQNTTPLPGAAALPSDKIPHRNESGRKCALSMRGMG